MRNTLIITTIGCVVLLLGCTKEIEKQVVYPNGDPTSTGSIVGLVEQKDSNAKVVISQATPIDSIDINPIDGSFRIDNLMPGNYDLCVKAQNYRTHWQRNIIINPGYEFWTGTIKLSNVPDLVDSYYPDDNSEIVFDRRWSQLSISINFTEAMDRESVEQAFSTDPPSEGVFYWGTFTQEVTPRYFWDARNYMAYDQGPGQSATISTFSQVKAFTYRMARKDCYSDTTYTITLSTAAKDTAGNHLQFPLQLRFATVETALSLHAIMTEPQHGDIFVHPIDNASIYITFPRLMDPTSVENAFTISPSADVIFIWPDPDKLRVYTGGPLMCEEDFVINIDQNALDLDGIPLGDSFEFSFSTAPIEIETTSPQNGEIFVSRDARIIFQFNTYMIKSSLEAAFHSSPGIHGSFIRGYEYNNGDPKNVLTLIPSGKLTPNTKHIVTIDTGAYDLHGTNIKEAYSFAFVTEPE